ncbi:hypothetical protein [Mycobacteroides abscessus]|uniref:hypothetical protein n=1 Tax=Mycobacteroides abscessus TaxID=36809 RepID=UPI000C25B1DE|nr:hypothetical protein [Mycobacteroides abscessus]
MRTDTMRQALAEIEQRWVHNTVWPNVDGRGKRRREDLPWTALVVRGDLGADEGHECCVYDPREGCVEDGHDNYQYVAWIDYMDRVHYLDPAASGYRQ